MCTYLSIAPFPPLFSYKIPNGTFFFFDESFFIFVEKMKNTSFTCYQHLTRRLCGKVHSILLKYSFFFFVCTFDNHSQITLYVGTSCPLFSCLYSIFDSSPFCGFAFILDRGVMHTVSNPTLWIVA